MNLKLRPQPPRTTNEIGKKISQKIIKPEGGLSWIYHQ
jgi:hypothetical protein